jgi:hypothetical protein
VSGGDPRNTFDAGGLEVFGLDPDQRFAAGDHLRTGFLPDGSPDRQHPVEDDPADDRHQDPGGNAFGPERDRARARARQQHLVSPCHFDRDLGSGIACSHDEDVSLLELARVLVLGGMKLDDPAIELGREIGNARALPARHRNHDVVRFESSLA